MNPFDRIELDPRVCNGRPAIRGTTIPASVILEPIAQGESWRSVLEGYPELKGEDIQQAVLDARANLEHTEIKAVGRRKGEDLFRPDVATGCGRGSPPLRPR